MSDPFAEDLARKSGTPAADPFADDIKRKWEASPQYARLKMKHEKTMADVERMKAEPGPFSPSELWKNRAELGRDFLSGAGTVAHDELNAATLGLYNRGREALMTRVAPDAYKASQDEDARNRQTPGFGLASGVGQGGASGLGVGGKVYQGVQSLIGAGKPIATGALAGGLTSGTQAAVESAGKKDLGGVLADTGKATALGAGLGAGFGAAARYIGGAPARKAESELAGLKEGVQNKTRVQKFQPNEEDFRVALAEKPDLRALAKADPVTARPAFHQAVEEKATTLLNPFYERMAQTGQDGVPIQTLTSQLQAARAGFNKFTDKGAIALIDTMIDDMTAHAAQNNGVVPAQLVRETATSFGKTGFANLPMFGQIPVGKEVKQDISGALRESIADHVESLAQGPAGKALRDAYQSANREVSTWIKMRDIVDEKARRVAGNATPMADLVTDGLHAIKHPYMTAAKLVAGKVPDAIDRRVLGPAVASRAGQALAPVGQAAQMGASPATTNVLLQKAQEQKRRDAEMAARLRAGR
jgi:hypothetical protein